MQDYQIILTNEDYSLMVEDCATTVGATVLAVGTTTIQEEALPSFSGSSNLELHTVWVARATYYSQDSSYQERQNYQETVSVLEIEERLESTGVLTLLDSLPVDTYLLDLPGSVVSSDCDLLVLSVLHGVIEDKGIESRIVLPHECGEYKKKD